MALRYLKTIEFIVTDNIIGMLSAHTLQHLGHVIGTWHEQFHLVGAATKESGKTERSAEVKGAEDRLSSGIDQVIIEKLFTLVDEIVASETGNLLTISISNKGSGLRIIGRNRKVSTVSWDSIEDALSEFVNSVHALESSLYNMFQTRELTQRNLVSFA